MCSLFVPGEAPGQMLKVCRAPISHIICDTGTGNGMVQALLHSAGEPFSMSNAVFAIIRG
jgi:hypothetical protein